MTHWEKKIIGAFIGHYFASAPETGEDRRTLRLRSSTFFPDFDTVHSDEKDSYLEAAESLERKGIVKLRWEKRGKGERLKTLSCENFEVLFTQAGKPHPGTEAEKIKTMLGEKISALKEARVAEKLISLLEYFSQHFSPREIGQGLNQQTMEELIRLLEYSCERTKIEKITTRALSILLYNDSKHLENLLVLCAPLLLRAQKAVPSAEFTFPERSYPETMISGKLIFEFKNSITPMLNAEGLILNLPLESVLAIENIKPISKKSEKTALTIENKETFFALGNPRIRIEALCAIASQMRDSPLLKNETSENLSCYDCFLYTGGYPNRAAATLIKTLASSGFTFHHAGDLDPDGILILQNIREIAERPVTPIRMDASTFDQYKTWARPLTKSMLRQTEKIREETRAIPEIAGLLRRIEETCLGVEQEIVDYR
jgi:hypothetical protein